MHRCPQAANLRVDIKLVDVNPPILHKADHAVLIDVFDELIQILVMVRHLAGLSRRGAATNLVDLGGQVLNLGFQPSYLALVSSGGSVAFLPSGLGSHPL